VNDSHPSISPDGKRIVFASPGKGGALFLMNADGSNQQPLLKKADLSATNPDWSPDGKSIAFTSQRDGNDEIYAVNVDGSNERRLTNDEAKDWDPAWSPDGTRIAFASDRAGNFDIYVMYADGGTVRPVTKNSASEQEPQWTVDGKRINYTRHTTVYISNVDGTNARVLLNNAFGVAWSPDGTQFVFGRPGNTPEVFVAGANGQRAKQLTKNKTPDYSATWGK
jgi:TolB protein